MASSPLDACSQTEEDYQRLILDNLLYFFPGPFAMLSAYIDESGTNSESPAMCVAGLLYTQDAVKQLDTEWGEALREAGISYFHAVESSHLRGEFAGWKRADEDRWYRKFIGIINKHACGGAVAYLDKEEHFDTLKPESWKHSAYTTCAYACVKLLTDIAKRLGDQEKTAIMIERGHKFMGELDSLLKNLSDKGLPFTHGFLDKKSVRPLQTADAWAYETFKRVRDQLIPPNKSIRKSLKVLIENDPNKMVLSLDWTNLQNLFAIYATDMLD